jgi:hypothetical protein
MSFFTGADAQQIEITVQNILMDYLRGKLNDDSGDYQPALGGKHVLVTNVAEVASEAYKQGNGIPFILLSMPEFEQPYTADDGQGFFIRRYEMKIPLDGSMSDHAALRTQPGKAVNNDHKLMSAVRAIVENGFADLQALGIEQPRIQPDTEDQTSNVRRNPFAIYCGVNTKVGYR